MRIVLATGIYPPDIGGPATYVRRLAEELSKLGNDVTIITYALAPDAAYPNEAEQAWRVIRVSKSGGPLIRWRKYAQALKEHAAEADVIECFSSVSCGMPLKIAGLTKPKTILRLGGDFAWERYTDWGGRKSLRHFIAHHRRARFVTTRLLKQFNHVVFSTHFQQHLYSAAYQTLPQNSIIQNALPRVEIKRHKRHDPLRLLYFGRFVKFKNLERLLRAVAGIPLATLTLVGEGPQGPKLLALARTLQLQGRITVVPPVHGEEVQRIFADHDVLVIPSITEISPNAALEARASGLPVLLTDENGLSPELRDGMIIRPTISTTDITKAILEVDQRYDEFADIASAPFVQERGWEKVAEEHQALFTSLS